ncbi:YtxH domain-containing protein [Rubrivirga marina]|uniref:Uncharacterized protein n=1 Tax=Rubrivirga marina TaxID=1196024 RepID=A0A271IUE2_9BACT|nr:YtxH domain-containing protein [Rubrivirga marina]PAP74189.1 hypothetical protein BSZ37_21245 [Rubrivirga marina]
MSFLHDIGRRPRRLTGFSVGAAVVALAGLLWTPQPGAGGSHAAEAWGGGSTSVFEGRLHPLTAVLVVPAPPALTAAERVGPPGVGTPASFRAVSRPGLGAPAVGGASPSAPYVVAGVERCRLGCVFRL